MTDWSQYLIEILSHPLIVSICTLIVSLSLSYFFSLRREKKMTVIIRHSDELKKLAERWKKEIPSVSDPRDPLMIEPALQNLPVEDEYLFSDLQEHTPSNLNLIETWDNYKELCYLYYKERFLFTHKIIENINKKVGLPFNSNWLKGSHGFSKSLIDLLFSDLSSLASGHERYYLMSDFKINKNEKYELWRGGLGIAWGKEHEINKTKEVIVKIFSELPKSWYFDNFKDLVKKWEELLKIKEEFNKKINDFMSLPLFLHECKYIKLSLN